MILDLQKDDFVSDFIDSSSWKIRIEEAGLLETKNNCIISLDYLHVFLEDNIIFGNYNSSKRYIRFWGGIDRLKWSLAKIFLALNTQLILNRWPVAIVCWKRFSVIRRKRLVETRVSWISFRHLLKIQLFELIHKWSWLLLAIICFFSSFYHPPKNTGMFIQMN